MQACDLQRHWLIASLTVFWLNRARSVNLENFLHETPLLIDRSQSLQEAREEMVDGTRGVAYST